MKNLVLLNCFIKKCVLFRNYSFIPASMFGKFLAFFLLMITLSSTVFAQRTASVSGNWSNTATWGGSSVPTSSDAVTINAGVTVTVDVAANAASATLNGTLNVNSGSNNLTIANGGSVVINSGGTIVFNSTAVINGGGNGSNGITLTINSGGNVTTANTAGFTNPAGNGTGTNGFTMNKGNKTWAYNSGANYTFNGTSAQTTGTAITAANNLTINNSSGVTLSSAATISTITIGDVTSNSVFDDGGFQITSTGILNLTSGTFKLGAGSSTTFPAFGTTNISSGTTVEYAATPAQNVSSTPSYQNLTFSGGTKTAGSGTLSVAGNWAVGSMTALNTNNPTVTVTGNITGSGNITNGSGTINIGGDWTNNGSYNSGSGTVNYTKTSGGQTIGGVTYNNLTLSNTSGTNTAGANVSVSGTLTQSNALAILDMSTFALSGNLTPSISSTIKTQNTSATPITTGKTWGGTVQYNATTGSQTIMAGTYSTLTLSNTSGTNTASGALSATNFNTTAGGTLDMTSFTLSATTINHAGILKIQNTSATPIPTGKTWNGTIEYNSTSAQTIVGGTYNSLTISATEAKTLGGTANVNGVMTFANGIVTTTASNLLVLNDNATISGGSSSSHVSGPIKKVGNDAFTFPVGKSGVYAPIAISAPSLTTDEFTAEYMRSNAHALGPITASGLTQVSACEYWQLERTTGTSNVNVTLSWSSSSPCNSSGYITDLPTLVVAHFNGTSWDSYGNDGGTTGNTTSGTITWNAVSSFSPFTLGGTSITTNPLPVKFASIKAFQITRGIQIDWTSMTEINVNYYEIERSSNGQTFITIGQINAISNNNDRVDYTWVDNAPFNGNNFYRIKSIDQDGKITYSMIVRVSTFKTKSELIVYPNPVKGSQVTLQLTNLQKGRYSLQVCNNLGQKIYSELFDHHGGSVSQSLRLPASVTPGTYNLQIRGQQISLVKVLVIQ